MQWGSKLSKMESAGVALVDPTATRDGTLWLRAEVARLSQQDMQCALPVMRAREISPTPPEIGKHQEIKRQLTTKPVGERPPPSRSRARAIDSHRAEEHWQPEVARRPTWSNGLSNDQLRTCNANQLVHSASSS